VNLNPARVTLAVLAASLVLAAVLPLTAQAQKPATTCCFNNQRYTGTCEVTPGEGESCASILAYLNNPSSTGKSYCGSTTIRGGWSQVQCGGEGR
jgi:hypothetical protein